MRKLTAALLLLFVANTIKAQEKVYQWAMVPDYTAKGQNGKLTINLPAQAAMIFTVARAGNPKILYTWRNSTIQELPEGNYDITFWGIKIPVTIEKQKETRIYAGVLNSTVKKPWEVWTTDSVKVFSAGSSKMVALPAGKYIIKTSGIEIKTTIRDGQVSIFSYGG